MKFCHRLFEEHASKNPSKIAVMYREQTLTYDELNQKANLLAHHLIKSGVLPGTRIGISLERSPAIIVAILGILKAGGTFIPIDPEHPFDRITQICKTSKLLLLLTQKKLTTFDSINIKKIFLDDLHADSCPNTSQNPLVNLSKDTLAYIIYTSGSTGVPKGVMICHSNLMHMYDAWMAAYQLSPSDKHLQMAHFTFDVFTGDLIRSLCSGGTLILCPKGTLLNPRKLYRLLIDTNITCAEFVPTVLRRLLNYLNTEQLHLDLIRLLICGSDNWSMHEYRDIQKYCSNSTRVINSYGLTETTIDNTYFETDCTITDQFPLNQSVPIGKPFRNTEIFILDSNLLPTPKGKIGEIYIAGPGLAKGYADDPILTAEKFIQHPKLQKRLYKTGDLGQYIDDENIIFLGRIDNQVKIRGIRVELSDIENILNTHPSITESLVSITFDLNKEKTLIAYVVLNKDYKLDNVALKKFLQTKLPMHMIPSDFIRLETMPLTASGKLNRKLLTV